ncbi:DEAD/DEAH box helicase, partial [Escherichia coli]|uniref:DEAD/DEAH box helicase n=2 Tax=Bacteria TaxID=2 RepID=UPI003CE53EE4
GLNIAIAHLAGGSDRDRQIARFEQNKPQLVIATPGRLLDFADKKILLLDQVKNFVIDEADMTLDLGFLADVDKIAARLPKDVVMSAF